MCYAFASVNPYVYFFGRFFQLSGLSVAGYAIVLLFNPAQPLGPLFKLSLVGVALFFLGDLILRKA